MDAIKLYFKFLTMHLKSAMTYKASFFFSCIGQVLISLNTFLGVVFLLDRFDTVGGYTLPQLSLCYGAVLMGFSAAECFGRGFDVFPRVLREAWFDRILVRPRGVLFQMLCHDMRTVSLARILQGAVMLAWGAGSGAVRWTFPKALTLCGMVLCGAAVFFGVFVVSAALCFFTTEGLEVVNIFTNGIMEYGKYPFDVYGKGILWLLTLIVPFALVQYWPLQYLLDRGPGWYGLLPFASLLFLVPCFGFWRFGVSRYRSTGS